MQYETIEVELCLDYAYVVSNGVESDDMARAAERMALIWPYPWNLHDDCGEGDGLGFRQSSCEGCGNPDHGDRHRGVAMAPVRADAIILHRTIIDSIRAERAMALPNSNERMAWLFDNAAHVRRYVASLAS